MPTSSPNLLRLAGEAIVSMRRESRALVVASLSRLAANASLKITANRSSRNHAGTGRPARAGRPVPAWFLDDLFAVIFKDAFAASRLSEATTSALLSRRMETMASPANLSKFGDDVGIGQDAVTRHVG